MEQLLAAHDQSPLRTPREIAALLRCSVWRIYALARARKIPAYANGRRLLFDASEVLEWFRESCRIGPADTVARRQVTPRRRRRRVR